MRSMPSCECLCSEFSLAQQKRTKEGLGPVLAGQRGSAHRTDMKISGFIRQRKRRAAATWKEERRGGKRFRSQRAGGNMVGTSGGVWLVLGMACVTTSFHKTCRYSERV